MSHDPKTKIGQLARQYRECEHMPDYLAEDIEDEDGNPIPTVKTDLSEQMKILLWADACDQRRGREMRKSVANWNRHGRSWKKHTPVRDGEVATDSHGRLLYVLGENGKRVTHGYVTLKMSEIARWNPRATGANTGVTA
jgi:hypothetical protein